MHRGSCRRRTNVVYSGVDIVQGSVYLIRGGDYVLKKHFIQRRKRGASVPNHQSTKTTRSKKIDSLLASVADDVFVYTGALCEWPVKKIDIGNTQSCKKPVVANTSKWPYCERHCLVALSDEPTLAIFTKRK
jgi:hypothetical protein